VGLNGNSRHSALRTGSLIVNADDWGCDRATTDRILDCIRQRKVSSASGMVFMEDSERAATLAGEHNVDVGIHLNFTTPYTAQGVDGKLLEHQKSVAAYLKRRRLNQAIYHPGLSRSFEYVVKAQLEEYRRLYGAPPTRIDGHHHMHLCANVLVGKLMPAGTTVRRNFSFGAGEKGFVNRWYRKLVDNSLARRHRIADYFFALTPMSPLDNLLKRLELSQHFIIEVETHPVAEDEYAFLVGSEFGRLAESLPWANRYSLPQSDASKNVDAAVRLN
jgi:chitin disaccharide deacetylase